MVLVGTLKRMVWRKIMGGACNVTNASEFIAAVRKDTNVQLILVKEDKIQLNKEFLDQRWADVTTLKGTQSKHYVEASGPYCVAYSHYSGAVCSTHNFKSHSKTYVLTAKPVASRSSPVAVEIREGDFVRVSLEGKRSVKQYAAIVSVADGDEFEVQFLRRVKPSAREFTLHDKDSSWMTRSDCHRLPIPTLDKRGRYVLPCELPDLE